MFGGLGLLPLLGLPGNPVSAFVCALLFLKPAIARLAGLPDAAPETETARLKTPMKANDQREDYVRAMLSRDAQGWLAEPFPMQDSGMLRTLAKAEALILRAPFAPAIAAGEGVQMIRLGQFGL
jgi:molybdopterin molybdotransferase